MKFLRFPDEQTFLNAVAPFTDAEGGINIPNLDVVGIIYEGGTYDDEGNVITPPTPKPGWHVNTLEPIPEWDPYRIPTPETPTRVYAGGVIPVCYRFPDKDTFMALMQGDNESLDQK